LKDKNNNVLVESRDFVSYFDSVQNELIKTELIFAGYGWTDPDTGYDDLEGLDVEGKFVMVMTRNPAFAKDTSKTGFFQEVEFAKIVNIFSKGAKGVLIYNDPLNVADILYETMRQNILKGTYLLENNNLSLIPGKLIFIPAQLANELLKTQNKSIEGLQNEIHKTGKPQSFQFNSVSAEIQLSKKTESVNGKNVIAHIEGNDPELKKECVIISAHYDHVGIQPDGRVFNGADDNASGTAALLEIAEAFSQMKKKPRRSIVFVWFTAEELGILGSEYYTRFPLYSLPNTVACINLDMVGRIKEDDDTAWSVSNSVAGKNGFYIISCKQSSELMEISHKISKKQSLEPNDALTDVFLNRSDYYPFYRKGIPVMGLTTGLHSDYHQVSDDVEKINYAKMKRLAEFAFLVTQKVSNQKRRIVVDNSITPNN